MLTFSVHFEAAHSLFGTPDHGVPVPGISVEGVQAVSALQPIVPGPVGGWDALVAPDPTSVGGRKADTDGRAEDQSDP